MMKAPCLFMMDYDKYRDDQLNTGVIAALLGGFALTNSWEMELSSGNTLDYVMYVLAILAVHMCTCSAITSAVLYRVLTYNDPEQGVMWMKKHSFLASVPFKKFVIGTCSYIISVFLVAWKELSDETVARFVALSIGLISASFGASMIFFLCIDPPHKIATKGNELKTIELNQSS